MAVEKKIAFFTQQTSQYYIDQQTNSWLDKVFKVARDSTFGGIPHLGALIIGSEAKANSWSFDIHNLCNKKEVDRIFGSEKYLLYFLSVLDRGRDDAQEIIDRHPDLRGKIVVGGQGITVSDKLSTRIPITHVVGRGESVISQILNDYLSQGEIDSQYQRNQRLDLTIADQEPYLDEKISLRKEPFFSGSRLKMIELSTGCTQHCMMCPVSGEKVTIKPIETAIKEIESMGLRAKDILVFIDHNLFNLPTLYLKQIFKHINEKKIDWVGEGTIFQVFEDDAIMNLMAERCLSFLVGLETVSSSFDSSKIKTKLLDDFPHVLANIRRVGLPVTWSLVFPFDTQTKNSYLETADFVLSNRININTHLLQPRVGSAFYYQITNEGRWRDQDSRKRDGAHLVFNPKQMSWEEAMAGFIWFRQITSSSSAISDRFRSNINNQMDFKKALYLAGIDYIADHLSALRMRQLYPQLGQQIRWYEDRFTRQHPEGDKMI